MPDRRQKATDDEVFAATRRAMTRHGPHELTLAHIAAEAGLSPGRLVQRFGSKRALLLALAERFAGSAPALFGGLRASHPRPLDALRAYAMCMADLAATPEALSRNLAYLQLDLTDPAFHTHLLSNARASRRAIAGLIREAIAGRALRPTVDPARLARTVETVISGSLMTWACYRTGSVAAWIRRDLDAVLEPCLSQGRRRTAAAPGRGQRRKIGPSRKG